MLSKRHKIGIKKYFGKGDTSKYQCLALAPLARTNKGGARRGGANVKDNGAVAVARKNWSLFAPFQNQSWNKNLIKIATRTSWTIKIPASYN